MKLCCQFENISWQVQTSLDMSELVHVLQENTGPVTEPMVQSAKVQDWTSEALECT
jgi:hypothetical protein